MNAFKAYKACVPIAWSPNLYITLVRGMPGTRRLHRRTLEALRLRKCNRTIMRWNTPTVRGMLQQVKRLVVIETEEMYKARKQKDEEHRALRPPLASDYEVDPSMLDCDEFINRFHRALFELHLEQGALICPETGRHFPVNKGIPNMLLHEDEV